MRTWLQRLVRSITASIDSDTSEPDEDPDSDVHIPVTDDTPEQHPGVIADDVYQELLSDGPQSIGDICDSTGYNTVQVSAVLDELSTNGMIRKVRSKEGDTVYKARRSRVD